MRMLCNPQNQHPSQRGDRQISIDYLRSRMKVSKQTSFACAVSQRRTHAGINEEGEISIFCGAAARGRCHHNSQETNN